MTSFEVTVSYSHKMLVIEIKANLDSFKLFD